METQRGSLIENGGLEGGARGESSQQAHGSVQKRRMDLHSAYAQEPHNEWGWIEAGATTARRHTPIEADSTQAVSRQPPSIPGLQMDDILTPLNSARKKEDMAM